MVDPLLIKAMYEEEPGSTGALLISRFHQLSAGKIGSGAGRVPPRIGEPARILLAMNTRNAGAVVTVAFARNLSLPVNGVFPNR